MSKTLDKVEIDPELVAEAEAIGVDVPREIAVALRAGIEKKKRELAWRESNRDAVQFWNRHVEEHGLWYERLRDS